MQTVSVSPLPAGSVRWQQPSGAWVLTVVCKATFELQAELCVLRSEQEPLHAEEIHSDGDPSRSLVAPADIVPGKPRADVVLVGSAFAPGGKAVSSLVARLTVAEVDKAVEVLADRSFLQNGELRAGSPFTQMSLSYERAAGGPETYNPVGIRADARDAYGRRPLPNLQRTGLHVTDPDAWIDTVGFGPIAAAWPTRHARIGRYGSAWSVDEWRRRPFPDGFDHSFFNAAPSDQLLAGLEPDLRIALENLHRDQARLVTRLPGLRPVAFLVGRSAPTAVGLRADTLWIDTERAICTLTFRGQLQLEHADEKGRVLVGMQRPDESLGCADLERLAPAAPRKSQTGTAAMHVASLLSAGGGPSGAPLPFRGTPSQGPMPTPGDPRPADGALPFASAAVPAAPTSGAPDRPSSPGWPPPSGPGAPPVRPWAPDAPASPTSRRVGALPAQGMPAVPSAPFMPPPLPAGAVAPSPPRMTGPPPPAPPPTAPAGPPPIAQVAASPWVSGVSAASSSGTPATGAPPPASLRPRSAVPLSPIGVGPGAAAAAAVEPWLAPPAVEPASPPKAVESAPPAPVVRVHQLLWFDAASVPRMRRHKAWRPLLDALEDRPADPELDDAALGDDAMALEDRREVFEILSQGRPSGPDAMSSALRAAVRPDGKLVPPLVLGAGELEMPFDELETLKATIAAAEPLVVKKPPKKPPEPAPGTPAPPPPPEEPPDELEVAVSKGKEVLKTPDSLSPPSLLRGLVTRIRDAFATKDRGVPASYLPDEPEAVLLEKRHYQKRIVFGDTYLRSLWAPIAEEPPVPVYLPESLAKKLPLFKRFEARWIAEACGPEDQYEKSELALRVVALARILPSPKSS